MRKPQIIAIAIFVTLTSGTIWCQHKITSMERERAHDMLRQIASDVKKHYYDPQFHGVDWESKVREMNQRIDKADTSNQALSEVAAALDSLHDSHAYFLPPEHSYRPSYGWFAQLIGGRCYIVRVRPGSDAETKGVKPGDEVLAINGFPPTKDNFWKMEYVFNVLDPQHEIRLDVRDPSGKQSTMHIVTKFTGSANIKDLTGMSGGTDVWDIVRQEENAEHLGRMRSVEMGDELIIVKFPSFMFAESAINSMIGKTRKHKCLILDLRGNPGGSIETLGNLLSGVFNKNVKVADRVGRDQNKPMIAKGGSHPFEGKLIVLLDSKSASAAELFARVVQIEKRGTVLGDLSSGSVMEAKPYSYKTGVDVVVFYGASITDADFIMTDGQSLEHRGVTPDELVLPTATDLAHDCDPVLAHAAELAGIKLTPEAAGKLFPYEWPHE